MSTTLAITTFSGNKSDFRSYLSSYLDAAAAGSSLCEFGHGLLGFILDFPPGHHPIAFVPLPAPGIEPESPNGDNAFAVSVHSANWSAWKARSARFQHQMTDLREYKTLLITSLDAVSVNALRHPLHGRDS